MRAGSGFGHTNRRQDGHHLCLTRPTTRVRSRGDLIYDELHSLLPLCQTPWQSDQITRVFGTVVKYCATHQAELTKSFLAGVMGPELLEPALGAPVGEDVEEAQELAMDPTRGADDARQEGVGDTPSLRLLACSLSDV